MSGLYGLFSWKTMLTKAGVNATATAVIFAVVGYISHGRATNDWAVTPDLQSVINMGIAAGMAALWAAGRNWAKNHPSSPLSRVFMTVAVVVAGICLQGCASMTPALAGKTNLSTEFRDVVNADGTQDTHYSQTVKAPAGVDLKNIASMQYNWDGQGAGNVAVASEPQANTQGQADALVKVNQQQMDLISKLMEQIVALAGIASPLVGGKITADAAQGQTDAVNKAALQQGILQALQNPEVLKAIKQATSPRVVKTPKVETPSVATPEPGMTLPGN